MKKLSGLLVAALAVFVLGACGGGNTNKDKDTKAESTLAAIQKKGTLKVGTSADFPPFEFHTMVDGKDTIVGADVDMVNKIAEAIGVKVDFVDTDFKAVLSGLESGAVDIGVSGISATDERKKKYDFSENYYNPPQKVVINKKNAAAYTSVDSLAGKKVGTQTGSIQEGIAKEQIKDANHVSVPKVPTIINELNQGSLDAMVVEETIGASYIAQNPDLQFADIQLESNPDEAYAIAVPKGSEELLAEINKVIKDLVDSGEMEEIVQKNIKLANEK